MSLLFQQTLSGLLKAIRASKGNEANVIATALEEISVEVKSTDFDTKAAAILKLIYIEMLGYPNIITYAFNVLECMASVKFHIKQIGYLAASQSFGTSTEVILLANNLIKKDLHSSSYQVVILALTSLPSLLVASPQLAEDILSDLLRILTHSRPRVRRIATLTIGKIWSTHTTPQNAIPIEFIHVEKLRSGLSDNDSSVVSATVNVMLELARTRPESLTSLLGLAPELFDLLTNSTNNWMLIKIAKLFALLTPVEPRLVRKLLPPLSTLISTTPAFSLLYECIQTVITGGMLSESNASSPLAQSCINKLSSFLTDSDQNLRYIALKGLSRLIINAPHTSPLLARYYDDILACIDEEDLTIRLKALELVERLTDRSNCKIIVDRLIEQISPSPNQKSAQPRSKSAAGALRAISSSYDPSSLSGPTTDAPHAATATASNFALANYRYKLLLLILRLTSRSSDDGNQLYVNITNFEWYIDTLIRVAYLSLSLLPTVSHVESERIARKLADCLLDVTARAAPMRPYAVKKCQKVIADEGFITGDNAVTRSVLSACAFVLGEYSEPGHAKANAVILLNDSKSERPLAILLGAMQCLVRWLDEVVTSWDESKLPEVKSVLTSTQKTLSNVGSEDSNLFASLVSIVIDGLAGQRLPPPPPVESVSSLEDPTSENDNPMTDDPSHNPFASSASVQDDVANTANQGTRLGAPVSLTLLHQIFSGYELRPLAPNAQLLVMPPIGLDLDARIGPEPHTSKSSQHRRRGRGDNANVDEYGRSRDANPSVSMAQILAQDVLTSTSDRKKTKGSKRKGGKTKDVNEEDDVDAIPIVKLELSGSPGDDGLEKSEKGKGKKRMSDLKQSREDSTRGVTRSPSPPLLILTAGGDLPVSRPTSTRPTAESSLGEGRAGRGVASKTDVVDGVEPNGKDELGYAVEEQGEVKVLKKKKKKKKVKGGDKEEMEDAEDAQDVVDKKNGTIKKASRSQKDKQDGEALVDAS